MTTVIYVRQSLDRDATGAAVDRQLAECRDLARRQGLTPAREFIDNDVSATKGVRPGFQQLLQGIRSGSVSTIIVWHPDRLYRGLRDLSALVDLAEKHGLRVLTVRAGDIDLDSPAGRMMATMLAGAARYEVEQKAARQVAANVQRARAGGWQLSNRPYGYELVGSGKDRELRIVEEEAAILRECYRRYLAGESLYAISNDLNERGIPTLSGKEWSISQLRGRLRNPHYAGIVVYKGEEMGKGNWEPIIDTATWEQFKTTQTRRKMRHDWPNKTKHLLSGLLICGVCGGPMFARPEKGGRMSYTCRDKWCTSRNLANVEAWVEEVVLARLSQPDALSLTKPKVDVQPFVDQAQELRARKDDLAGLLADGVLTAAAVRESSRKLDADIARLQEQIGAASASTEVSDMLLAENLTSHWRDHVTLAQKRAVINALLLITVHKQANTRVFDPHAIKFAWRT